MSQQKVSIVIGAKVKSMVQLAEVVDRSFESASVLAFKEEFKNIKSWIKFVELQGNDSSLKMSEKVKKLYNVAGALAEAHSNLSSTADGKDDAAKWQKALDSAKKEWSKVYSKNVLHKLEQQLTEHDYSKVPTELVNNFISSHWKISIAESVDD
jgi:hypothetical protein